MLSYVKGTKKTFKDEQSISLELCLDRQKLQGKEKYNVDEYIFSLYGKKINNLSTVQWKLSRKDVASL